MKTVLSLLVCALLAVSAFAQERGLPPLYPDAYEIALARSAAPPELSDEADVYVLRRGGHEKVYSGTNGTACIVTRDHAESLYPICYDREGAKSILLHHMEAQRLREEGASEDSVDAHIAWAYDTGRIPKPERAVVTYMMSPYQVIYAGAHGRRVGRWHPHLMIYMPGLMPDDVGMAGLSNGDLSITDPGEATAHYIIMTKAWAKAAPLPLAEGRLVAEPGWLCSGDTYALRYEGLGEPAHQLVLAPEAMEPDTVAWQEGLRQVADGPTHLYAIGEDGVLASSTLSLHPEHMEHQFVRPSTCSGRLSLASMAIPPTRASDSIRPQSVTNQGKETVTITHRGVTVRLAPGERTDAFNGYPFSGDWGVVIDTGTYNPACPTPVDGVEVPKVEVIIITACQ